MANTNITFNVSNVSVFSTGTQIALVGKNGFISELGTIPILCTSYAVANSNIVFSLANVHLLHDDNFGTHLLNVRNVYSYANNHKGTDKVVFPVVQRTVPDTYTTNPFSSYYFEDRNLLSANILTYNLAANTLTISNPTTLGRTLDSRLPSAPFYVKLFQIVDPDHFSTKTLYVSGYQDNKSNIYDVSSVVGTITVPLGVNAPAKGLIKVFIDEEAIETSQFTQHSANSINVSITAQDTQVRTIVDYYTVPAIESGDELGVRLNNVYVVANTSYISDEASYNSILTTSNFFKITLEDNINANLTSVAAVNISKDVEATITAINLVANTFTVEYNVETYPGTYKLSNNKIYSMLKKSSGFNFNSVKPDQGLLLNDAQPGYYIVRARNISDSNRVSPFIQKVVQIPELVIGKVRNISLTESPLTDRLGGAAIRVIVSFNHLYNRDVTDYEISYILTGPDVSGFDNYITQKISARNVDSDNIIRYNINNIERGSAPGVNTLTVQVTPLNGNIRGIPNTSTKTINGKLDDFPSALTALNVVQQDEVLIFGWTFPTNDEGNLIDQDLKEVEIREFPGSITSTQAAALSAYINGRTIARIPFPNNSFIYPIQSFGIFTYILATRDTSDNSSTDLVYYTITITRPNSIGVFKVYNEDTPNVEVISGMVNSNYGEPDFPSFSISDNGGFVYVIDPVSGGKSTATENANGTSTGFSVLNAANSDLNITGNSAIYVTAVRDVGDNVTATIRILSNTIQNSLNTFSSFKEIIYDDVSDRSTNTMVLVSDTYGGLGTILGYNNTAAATVTYNANLRTLVSGGTAGNVFAIWNPGQGASPSADTANSGAFALIAGTLNANAIVLGNVYHANARVTGANAFGNVVFQGNSFQLVNLLQFIDTPSNLTFSGIDRNVIQNLEIRYATANVYYANTDTGNPSYNPAFLGPVANVNTSAWINYATNKGYELYVPGEKTFRYFQLRVTINNKNPSTANIIFDALRYEVDVKKKTFNLDTQVNSVNGIIIDYSGTAFVQEPAVTALLKGSSNAYVPVIRSKNKTNCNVIVYASNGTAVTTEVISLVAQGI